jgi:LysM repeat protein
MNNISPFIPQGSISEQKNKGRARVKIAVFFVLAVHGVGLLALLMQGCRRDDKEAGQGDASSNAVASAPTFNPTNTTIDTNPPPAPTNPTPIAEMINSNVTPLAATPTDYTIAAGDTFSTIAPKFKVSVRALEGANPGVDPKRLQVGQKIKIPPPAPATAASTTGGGTAPAVGSNGEIMYTVVSGDTLTTIAKKYHTTASALRSYNSLTTDNIKVGQKLKIPPGATTPAPGSTAPPASGAR